jgi:hypothetical protein
MMTLRLLVPLIKGVAGHWWIAGDVQWNIANGRKSTDVSDEFIPGNNAFIGPE